MLLSAMAWLPVLPLAQVETRNEYRVAQQNIDEMRRWQLATIDCLLSMAQDCQYNRSLPWLTHPLHTDARYKDGELLCVIEHYKCA
jgi:hypothetical protein